MSFPDLKPGSGLQAQALVASFPQTQKALTNEKPKVFLTSVKIPDDHIWANGLFQNVYVIYRMFENLGWEPYLVLDNIENNKDANIHKDFRQTDFKTYIQAPFKIQAYIEVAMSCDPSIRKFFRSMGAKVAKLYLGNILNIDIETITFYKGVNFSHHVAGELDEIWVSPHYDIHAQYAGSVNGLTPNVRIAPYLWEPLFMKTSELQYNDKGLTETSPRRFVIMEPNISFQKNSLIAIMAVEAYYRKFPERVFEVVVVNGHKFKENPFFMENIAPYLQIYKDGKLQLMPRAHFINLVKVLNDAIVLQHQVNNEYNYSFMEWLTLGFPLIHNVPRFKSYGYYYEGNDFDAGALQIEQVTKIHSASKSSYETQAKQLAWQFSASNPKNLEAWRDLAHPKER